MQKHLAGYATEVNAHKLETVTRKTTCYPAFGYAMKKLTISLLIDFTVYQYERTFSVLRYEKYVLIFFSLTRS